MTFDLMQPKYDIPYQTIENDIVAPIQQWVNLQEVCNNVYSLLFIATIITNY